MVRRSNKRVSRGSKRNPRAKTFVTSGGRPVLATLLHSTPLFPPSVLKRGQLYYEYQLGITSTAGVVGSYVFSVNGAFDPNITGTGHQPMGFDQMMNFYDQYTVRNASASVSFAGLSAGSARVGLSVYDDSSVTTDPSRLVEGGLMKMGVVGTGNGSQRTVEFLSLQCDVSRYFGARFLEIKNNYQFSGTVAANPTEQLYFAVCLWGGYNNASTTILFDIVIAYDIFYFEPKHPQLS